MVIAGLSPSGSLVLAALVILLIWLGVYPGTMIEIIQNAMHF
jgi:NADH:ubiquinone oxidoreductase subunit 4 (subunit M)